uniref:Uncharacterized protein n=1 Tax=Amphimedon queenslandica TaxID=400682 RepID=A0A1X7T682_AMPQE
MAKACSKDSRYETKISLLYDSGPNVVDPYMIPKEQWIDDPMKWPSLEFALIYTYHIGFPGLFTKEKLKAYKSLKAYNYYIRYMYE